MAKSDALFLLVKSLDGAEKRYFKANFGKAQGKFLQLFNAMAALVVEEEYDEKKLLRRIHGVIDEKNLSYGKNYVFQAILKSLRNYHSGRSPSIQLKELMFDIALLSEKGLVNETLKQIAKAKKLALKYDFRLPLLELMLMERRLVRQHMRKGIHKKLTALQDNCLEELIEVGQQFESLNIYEDVFLKILHSGESDAKNENIEKRLSGLLPFSGGQKKSFFEKAIYSHLAYSMIYLLDGNHGQRMFHLKSLLELFEENEFLLNEEQYNKRYINCLNNYINSCYNNNELDEMIGQISKLKKMQPKSKNLSIQIEQYVYYAYILFFFKKEEFSEIVKLAPEIESYLSDYGKYINLKRKITFKFNLAAAFLLEKEYDRAHEMVNQITNEPKFEIRKDIQMLTRIMRIILFIEEEEFLTAEYQVYSAIRYLKKFRKNNPVEKQILDTLKKVAQFEDLSLLHNLADVLVGKNGYEEISIWLKRALGEKRK